jgi:hypothetical protein
MPELDGMGFLEAVRQRFPDSSVIMLSGISETTTAVDCLHLGAADFLLKPISLSELQARVTRALEKRALVLQNRFYQKHLERQVQEQAQRIQELFLQGVQMLARALEAKDAYTRGHSIRVSQYAVGTAARLGFAGHDLDGIHVDRGSVLIVSPWLLHHDPRWWADPQRFDPERFADEDPDRPRHAYLPFGGGPRICIGEGFARMEAALLVASIARRWRFELDPTQRVELQPVVTLRPRYGMRMRAIPRS